MSDNDYPDEEELQQIREWDAIKDPKGLMDFICSIWHWGESMFSLEEDYEAWRLELHTGGWSGNEEIIGALNENGNGVGFWFFYWVKSERGGHFWFQVPKKREGQR